MKTLFQSLDPHITDIEVIESFQSQNPTKKDYYDLSSESDPAFFTNSRKNQKSSWDSELDIKKIKKLQETKIEVEYNSEIEDRYSFKLPEGFREIELYDNCKCFDKNFELGQNKKYILIEVNKDEHFTIVQPDSILPTPQSKCIIDIKKVEEYSSLEFIPIDYDTFFGLRFLTFIKYDNNFFTCDERVMFEALLIKFKSFNFKSFFWSKEKMQEEVGIKKDRSTKIIDKFIKIGIISKEVRKSFINNRPMQINYYDLDAYKVIELAPKMFKERENVDLESKLREYLMPALDRNTLSKMQ